MWTASWKKLDYKAEVAWLIERTPDAEHSQGTSCGFDVEGWPSSVWILNAMYENDSFGRELADIRRKNETMGRGETELALLENSISLDDSLDEIDEPTNGWVRIRWSELARRVGVDLRDQDFPPCHQWFSNDRWPDSVQGPPEGSLDKFSARRLAHLLQEHGAHECIAAYALLAYGFRDPAQRCFRGPVKQFFEFENSGSGPFVTPSNVWSLDRSWFIYTDHDLWGTKVSGPIDLIQALKADKGLETIDWYPASREPNGARNE
jgi:hypothetical protein